MEKKHQGAMLALIAHLVNGEWQSLTDDLADMDVLKPTTDRFAVRLVRLHIHQHDLGTSE
jgi:aarF domain-containing kinase